MSESTVTVPFFKKGKSRPTSNRKRDVSPPVPSVTAALSSAEPSTSRSEVVLPSRKGGSNLLSAGTKRQQTRQGDRSLSDEEERDGPDVKWTAAGSHQAAAQEILAGDEAEELAERRNKRTRLNTDIDDEVLDDGLYRGQKGYRELVKKDKEVPKAMRQGPQRSNANTVRTVTIVDYQPDVCKDYKGSFSLFFHRKNELDSLNPPLETGYCGFGDTCKFLHDRSNCASYVTIALKLMLTSCILSDLAGWQLDKLAANPKQSVDDSSESDSDDEDIPFACLICRKPYTDPVMTRCGHYFCSACAIKRYARTPKCAACHAPTGGIFNRADKVIEKMKKKDDAAKELQGDVQLEGLEVKGGAEESSESESE